MLAAGVPIGHAFLKPERHGTVFGGMNRMRHFMDQRGKGFIGFILIPIADNGHWKLGRLPVFSVGRLQHPDPSVPQHAPGRGGPVTFGVLFERLVTGQKINLVIKILGRVNAQRPMLDEQQFPFLIEIMDQCRRQLLAVRVDL